MHIHTHTHTHIYIYNTHTNACRAREREAQAAAARAKADQAELDRIQQSLGELEATLQEKNNQLSSSGVTSKLDESKRVQDALTAKVCEYVCGCLYVCMYVCERRVL